MIQIEQSSGRPASGVQLVRPAAQWMVLRTRSRQEKAVARYLAAQHIEHYLPLIDRFTTIRGRRLVSRVPLFPGYVFFAGELDDGYGAISTRRACQIVPVHDQETFVHEVKQIRRAIAEGAQLELYPFASLGRRCRVRRGPFQGIEGTVIERLDLSRLILSINVLGQGAMLEIDTDLLESC